MLLERPAANRQDAAPVPDTQIKNHDLQGERKCHTSAGADASRTGPASSTPHVDDSSARGRTSTVSTQRLSVAPVGADLCESSMACATVCPDWCGAATSLILP
jgi:hypothetical protein